MITSDIIAFAWIIAKIVMILVPILLMVAYYTYAERKVIGYMQTRVGPNRVGILGLGQPIADAVKLLLKEMIIPSASNPILFLIAPVLAIAPALAAWAVIPFSQHLVLANVNAGVLYLLAITSLGVYGILISGWASNSKYAFFGAMRSAAQVLSYEIAMGFAVVVVLLAADSANLTEIVLKQSGGIWHWFWLPLLPVFFVFFISSVAETNRHPFDMAEGESEIVAGFHVEYSGIAFACFFLGEYANIILACGVVTTFFLGGWLSPFQGIPVLESLFSFIPGIAWFFLKTWLFMFVFLWIRATFPRYRYDQLMRLGWKVLIPITIVWLVVVSVAIECHLPPWFA